MLINEDMRAFLIGTVFLFACAVESPTEDPQPQPDPPKAEVCERTPGSVCEAASLLMWSFCHKQAECNGWNEDLCVDAYLRNYCNAEDCSAPYAELERVQSCVDTAQAQACDTSDPVFCTL